MTLTAVHKRARLLAVHLVFKNPAGQPVALVASAAPFCPRSLVSVFNQFAEAERAIGVLYERAVIRVTWRGGGGGVGEGCCFKLKDNRRR